MNNHIYVAIIAGVPESCLWPTKASGFPKHFIDILGTGKTMIQHTVNRFAGLVPIERIFIVTPREYSDAVRNQIPLLPEENIVAEPCRKDTLPSAAYICFKLFKKDPDAFLVMTPADNLILQEYAFLHVCHQALEVSFRRKALVVLGIQPTYANININYIQRESRESKEGIYKVKCFTEKPDPEKALAYLSGGDYLWNSGVFICKATYLLFMIQSILPDVYELFISIIEKLNSSEEGNEIKRVYHSCPCVSFEVSMLKKEKNVFVIPASFGWSELNMYAKDEKEKSSRKQDSVIPEEISN